MCGRRPSMHAPTETGAAVCKPHSFVHRVARSVEQFNTHKREGASWDTVGNKCKACEKKLAIQV